MSIEVISRFNNGRGGVSLIIDREVGGEIHRIGQLLEPHHAIDVGIDIITKAFNSLNLEPPDIRKFVDDYLLNKVTSGLGC